MSDAIRQAGARVQSPCVNVCQMDEKTGLCAGCLRTLDEIAMWSVLDDEDRLGVLHAVARRRASAKD